MTRPTQSLLLSPTAPPAPGSGGGASELVGSVSERLETPPGGGRIGDLLPIGAILGQLLRHYDLVVPSDTAARLGS